MSSWMPFLLGIRATIKPRHKPLWTESAVLRFRWAGAESNPG